MTKNNSLHVIINKNYQVYTSYDQIEFHNVAAILKSFSNLTNSREYNNFRELEKNKKLFINKLSSEPISSNYPIKASHNEIIIIESFLNDVVKFLKEEDISANNFQRYINQASTIFVKELMEYEKKIYE